MPSPDSPVHRYHDASKHHFARFARSLGYLDWASQPHPFRTWSGARAVPLFPSPAALADAYQPVPVTFDSVRSWNPASAGFVPSERVPTAVTAAALGDLLRHALGLSAWKEAGQSRWSLRVNPSSGNLHPTEAYVICGVVPGLCDSHAVFHYAPDTHALEERCRFAFTRWGSRGDPPDLLLVALTSIHWREAWKYGERAFRYCQHDLGHAIAAVTYAAAILGWRTELCTDWSHRDIATLVGLDRDADFFEAEREEPGALLALTPDEVPSWLTDDRAALVEAARVGLWTGTASQLSEDHVQWTFIDEIAAATQYVATPHVESGSSRMRPEATDTGRRPLPAIHGNPADAGFRARTGIDARALVLQRRSAVAFDPTAAPLSAEAFAAILTQVLPEHGLPFHALGWTPRLHLLLFVHRVHGVAPGLYLLSRDAAGFERLRAAITRDAALERAHAILPLWRVATGDTRAMARRLSCDQDIASDGFFSLGMLAEFDAALDAHGLSCYRHLFWESGVIGHALYLAAEAAGVRGTGIGCFFDDAVHAVLGLSGHAFQSLYHFTIGAALEDRRLTTWPGYAWERR